MKYLIISILFAISAIGSSRAITADELALFLNICSWNTHIKIPPAQIEIEIFEIKNGKIGKSILKSNYSSGCIAPETDIRIIGTRHGQPTRIQLWLDGEGIENQPEKTGSISISALLRLPKIIEPGDYVLGGHLNNFKDPFSTKVSDYEEGLLMRVRKKG